MPRPSQKVIADRLGISTASVSLALRRKGTVSPELIEKVQAVAAEIGYQPNPILSSLASKRFKSPQSIEGTPIAVFDFLVQGVGAGNVYYDNIKKFASQLGYTVSVYTADELKQYNNPSATLYSRGVQGVILIGFIEDNEIIKEMDWNRFSVVQCCRFLTPLPFHTARPNTFQSIKESFKQVRKRGYKRIGFAPSRHSPIVEDDEARISAALGLIDLYVDKKDQIPPYTGPLLEKDAFLAWVEKYKPDAVIGFNHHFCVDLIEAGYRVPEDIGYASLHVSPGVEIINDKERSRLLRVTGIDQNIDEIAQESVIILDQNIHYHNLGIPRVPTQVLVDSSWVVGDTLK